jgi:hypothetical protein
MNKDVYKDFNIGKAHIQDTYTGTAVLIANGDSLNEVPFDFLQKHYTIGTNNIYLYGLNEQEVSVYPDIEPKFVPNFYTILGYDQVDSEEKRRYSAPVIHKSDLAFVNRIFYTHFDLPNVYAIHGIRLSTGSRPYNKSQFSDDIMDWVGIGFTNTYVMLQILFYLGFTEVLCVGLDNDYGIHPERLHFYPNDPRFACEPNMGRQSHQKGSNYVFGLAKEFYKAHGRKIININKKNNTPFEGRDPEW